MHTLKSFHNFLQKGKCNVKDLFIEKLPNGVRKIIFPKNTVFKNNRLWKRAVAYTSNGKKIYGAKTLWPEHYTEEMILNSIHEIIGNHNNYIKKGMFIGKTKDGIIAKVRLNKEGIVQTAYPDWIQ